MSYVVFGRAIKNEYLSLATIFTTAGLVMAARSGGKKEEAPKSTATSVVERVKEAIPINAGSSEEETFIKAFIEAAEAKH